VYAFVRKRDITSSEEYFPSELIKINKLDNFLIFARHLLYLIIILIRWILYAFD